MSIGVWVIYLTSFIKNSNEMTSFELTNYFSDEFYLEWFFVYEKYKKIHIFFIIEMLEFNLEIMILLFFSLSTWASILNLKQPRKILNRKKWLSFKNGVIFNCSRHKVKINNEVEVKINRENLWKINTFDSQIEQSWRKKKFETLQQKSTD